MYRERNHPRMAMLPAAAIAVLTLAAKPEVQRTGGDIEQAPGADAGSLPTIDIDPCLFGSEAALQALLQTHIAAQFPITSGSVRMSNPRVVKVTCPQLRAEIRTDIRYKKTTGVPQYSTSGETRLGSPIIARVTYSGGVPSPGNITKAEACLTNIDVLALNLNRIPNWLDNSWVRGKVNEKLLNSKCFTVMQPVVAHLQAGGQLQ